MVNVIKYYYIKIKNKKIVNKMKNNFIYINKI